MLLFKYEREIIFQGEFELSYEKEVRDRICRSSICGSGIELKILNSGKEIYPEFKVKLKGIPISYDYNFHYLSVDLSGDGYSITEPIVIVKKELGQLTFSFKDIHPNYFITIYVMNEEKVEGHMWGDVSLQFCGKGSVLNENPDKIVALSLIRNTADSAGVFKGVWRFIMYYFEYIFG